MNIYIIPIRTMYIINDYDKFLYSNRDFMNLTKEQNKVK